MENIIRFEGFLNESSEAEGKKAQMMMDSLLKKYETQGKSCFSKKTCPNLWGLTYGSLEGAVFLLVTTMGVLSAEAGGLIVFAPMMGYFGYKSYKDLSSVEQNKIFPELKSLAKCLGEDFFK